MELSQKLKTFFKSFITFLKFTLNLQHFEKKNEPLRSSTSEVIDSERCAYLDV